MLCTFESLVVMGALFGFLLVLSLMFVCLVLPSWVNRTAIPKFGTEDGDTDGGH